MSRKLWRPLFLVMVLFGLAGSAGLSQAQPQQPGVPEQDPQDALLEIPQLQPSPLERVPAAADVVYTEGFESIWPDANWTRFSDITAAGGEYLWDDRSCQPRSGNWAGYSTGGGAQGSGVLCPDGPYPNNLNTWAVWGPFNLSAASAAELVFYVKGESEDDLNTPNVCEFDYLQILASNDDDTNFFSAGAVCGPKTNGSFGNGYFGYALDLGDWGVNSRNWLGQPAVWIAFAMKTDGSVQRSGFTLDDISLDVTTACATPGAPALNSPTNGATLSDTTPTFSWNSVANGNAYTLQVDNNPGFGSPEIMATTAQTSIVAGNPLAPGTYNWRVRARNTAGGCSQDGPWSAVRTFTISGAPTCFLLTRDHTGNGSDPIASPASSPGCADNRYTAGQTINLSASPAGGWRVNNWQGTNNNGSSSTSNTTTMPAAAHTVRVNYVQNTGGEARAFLPSVQWGLTGFLGPLESEPNNTAAQANGPILLNRNYQGFPNDLSDYFSFELTSARQVNITLADITGKDPQLQLRNAANQLVGDIDATPPYSLSRNLTAGRYYVRVVVVDNNNSSVLYTLRVNAP